MAKVDWLGVASVLQEIGKMSEPNTLEKMQMEHELKMAQLDKKADQEVLKQQLKEQRELKKLNEKREFESLLKKVESYKGAIEGYETKISDIDKNISSMNIKGQKLNAGKGYAQIITDNDLAKKTGLQDSIVELENELGVWIDAYSEKKILENNVGRGKALYNAGVMQVDNEDGSKTVSFDTNNDQLIEKHEYEKALSSVMELELQLNPNADLRGLAEGFWSQHDEVDHIGELHDASQDKLDTSIKTHKALNPGGTGIIDKAKESHKLKKEKENLDNPILEELTHWNYNDLSEEESAQTVIKQKDKKNLDTVKTWLGTYGNYENIAKLTRSNKSEFLDSWEELKDRGLMHYGMNYELLRKELGKTPKWDGLAPEDDPQNRINPDYDFQFYNDEKFITRDLWDAVEGGRLNLFKNTGDFLSTEKGGVKNYHDNMLVKKAMFWVMNNWDKGIEGELGFEGQNTWDQYVRLIKNARRAFTTGQTVEAAGAKSAKEMF